MLKKIVYGTVVPVLLALAGTYLLIPAQPVARSEVKFDAADRNVFKFLTHSSQWQKWWPGSFNAANNLFTYQGYQCHVDKFTNNGANLSVTGKGVELNCAVSYAAVDRQTMKVSWLSTTPPSLNPFTRIKHYFDLSRANSCFDSVMQSFKAFMSNDYNLYQLHIKLTTVKTPNVLTTNLSLNHWPSVAEVYQQVALLQKTALQYKTTEVAAPMLNVHQVAKSQFNVMVGLPIKDDINLQGKIFINHMVLGKILVTDVTGGPNTIKAAFNRLQDFVVDNGLTPPAIPFELMITNRAATPDTSRWHTQWYYPIL